MKTISVIAPGQLEIIDTPRPEPGPYQALVRTELACLCNKTDSELVHGAFPGLEDAFPFALGHESVGIVEQIGDKVRNFAVGGRVVSGLVFDLGVEGLQPGWGGFCEYVLANDHEAMVADGVAEEAHGWIEVFEIQTPVDADIDPHDAVLLCTWREVLGAFRDFHLQPGDDVLVFGGGPVGLSFVKLGRLFGLGWIGLVDRHPEKQEKARDFGADAVFAPGDETIAGITATHGPLDAVIDAVGKAELINVGLPLLKRGGSMCVYGFMAGLQEFVVDNSLGDFNYNLFVHQWPTRLYEKEAQVDLCNWVRQGKLSAREFISHRFSIDQIEVALQAVQGRKVVKALLSY
ncbi:MAG: zinc-binding dehydrogenase [Candidatus Latescibacterota bacterium]|nr:zinc-binding dehydrogenase [Candidatus Latescibacterota bacterium]